MVAKAAALVLAALAFVALPAGAVERPHTLSHHQLRAILVAEARAANERHPRDLVAVGSTQARAEDVVSPGSITVPRSARRVFVLRAHGRFSCCSHPRNAAAPHGTVPTLIVDARTGALTDLALTDRDPPLRRLGRVFRL